MTIKNKKKIEVVKLAKNQMTVRFGSSQSIGTNAMSTLFHLASLTGTNLPHVLFLKKPQLELPQASVPVMPRLIQLAAIMYKMKKLEVG